MFLIRNVPRTTIQLATMQRPLILLTLIFSFFHFHAALGSSHINTAKRIAKAPHTIGVDMNSERSLWQQHSGILDSVKSAMLASIRTKFVFSVFLNKYAFYVHS